MSGSQDKGDEPEGPIHKRPFYYVSAFSGITLKKGAKLRKGGHFYSTESEIFVKRDHRGAFVFIQVEHTGILEEELPLEKGAIVVTVLMAKAGPLALAHPMSYVCSPPQRRGTYYFPAGKKLENNQSYAASPTVASDPPVTVEVLIEEPGQLTQQVPLIADGEWHTVDVEVR